MGCAADTMWIRAAGSLVRQGHLFAAGAARAPRGVPRAARGASTASALPLRGRGRGAGGPALDVLFFLRFDVDASG